tara:strand:+ start:1700 stop:1825 length:126 start_codon:yes stop_codon:yes gene_type:complete
MHKVIEYISESGAEVLEEIKTGQIFWLASHISVKIVRKIMA